MRGEDGLINTRTTIFAILAAIIFSQPQEARADETWKMVFDHAGFGRCQGYLSETKVVFDDGVLKRLIVSPFEESFVYNRDSKRYLRAPNDQFKAQAAPAYQKARIRKTGQEKLLGMNCDVYSIEFTPQKPAARFWATRDVKVDARLSDLLSAMCAAPEGFGVPMRLMVREKTGVFSKRMNVIKLEKAKPPADAFSAPRGYKMAKDLWDLHFCEDDNDYGRSVDKAFMIPYRKTGTGTAGNKGSVQRPDKRPPR